MSSISAKFMNIENTSILFKEGETTKIVPAQQGNKDYDRIINEGIPIDPFEVVVSVAEIKEEAQRRINAVFGATDITTSLIKQSNANMRANELNFKLNSGVSLTQEELGEIQALETIANTVKAIRAKSNELELTLPTNYKDDQAWA